MMIDKFSSQIADYAKDIRLNFRLLLNEENWPGLNQEQALAIALTASYATGHAGLIAVLEQDNEEINGQATLHAAKAANSIMAMNNIYYRFAHSMGSPKWFNMPAKLRMNIIAKPGIDQATFELMCMAISIINGCQLCMQSHANTLTKQGISDEGIQSTARVAAIIHATAHSLR